MIASASSQLLSVTKARKLGGRRAGIVAAVRPTADWADPGLGGQEPARSAYQVFRWSTAVTGERDRDPAVPSAPRWRRLNLVGGSSRRGIARSLRMLA